MAPFTLPPLPPWRLGHSTDFGTAGVDLARASPPVAVLLGDPSQPDLPIRLPRPDIGVFFWALIVAAGMAAFDKFSGFWRLAGRVMLSTVAGVAFGPATYHVLTTMHAPWFVPLPLAPNGWLALAIIIGWSAFGYRFFGGIRVLGDRFQKAPLKVIRGIWWLASKVWRIPPPPPEPPSPTPDPEADESAARGYVQFPRKEPLP